jgi:hypothetical protein
LIPSGSQQRRFRVAINKDALSASSSRASSYFEWAIIMDPKEIDTEETYSIEAVVPEIPESGGPGDPNEDLGDFKEETGEGDNNDLGQDSQYQHHWK